MAPQPIDTSHLPQLGEDWLESNPYRGNADAVELGASAYNQNCARCHGLGAVSGGIAPDLRLLPPDDEEWGKSVFFPRAKAAGWEYWAVVKPEKAVAELNVSRFVKIFSDLGVTTTLSSDFDAAWTWLVAAGK